MTPQPHTRAAIYFQTDAYSTSGKKLMGRNAAGESFLKGYLRYSRADAFYSCVKHPDQAAEFESKVREYRTEPVSAITQENLYHLTGAGTLFYPGPDIGTQAHLRSLINPSGWSLCGITHTTSSAGVMDAVTGWLTAPVEPWDAVICTSRAVKQNVTVLLQAEANRLRQRLGIQRVILPKLPVIPLGMNTDDFQFDPDQKAAARRALQADSNTVVILYMGRLSFHAKAHPLAMYQALETAARNTEKKIKLVECGWFSNDYIRNAFNDAAGTACPSVEVVHLDGRDPHQRITAWAGADIFCSLSDNIQETFGITPVEAMAAGLPVVVSDWDGYKDTVRHNTDGFRIPTTMPPAGLSRDLAFRYATRVDTYDHYCGHTCMHAGVDIWETARAFITLINDNELRQKMGTAGRQRARETYDWSAIIPVYEDLWSHLGQIRTKAAKENQRRPDPTPWPARMDPFTGFVHYPTATVTEDTLIARTEDDPDRSVQALQKRVRLEMVKFAHQVIPDPETLTRLLKKIPSKPTAVKEIIEADTPRGRALNHRAVCLLLKLGVVHHLPEKRQVAPGDLP